MNQLHDDINFMWTRADGLPPNVIAGQTVLGTSHQQHFAANFALHVHDEPKAVHQRRMALLQQLRPLGVQRLHWLNQTHSTQVYRIDEQVDAQQRDGDALMTAQQGVGLVMMTADCLPIVLASANGEEVACIHAGWRGLAAGIITQTVQAMHQPPIFAWLGAAISQSYFEVGAKVRAAFVHQNPQHAHAFIAKTQPNKYDADLYLIARQQLMALGVQQVTGGQHCSYQEAQLYSYRRQPQTGRMATFVCIQH